MKEIREAQRLKCLLPCPFCGGEAVLIVNVPMYGLTGAWVECCECKATGHRGVVMELIHLENGGISTPATHASIERGKADALRSWNSRRATI